jgi:hypothetical protein
LLFSGPCDLCVCVCVCVYVCGVLCMYVCVWVFSSVCLGSCSVYCHLARCLSWMMLRVCVSQYALSKTWVCVPADTWPVVFLGLLQRPFAFRGPFPSACVCVCVWCICVCVCVCGCFPLYA